MWCISNNTNVAWRQDLAHTRTLPPTSRARGRGETITGSGAWEVLTSMEYEARTKVSLAVNRVQSPPLLKIWISDRTKSDDVIRMAEYYQLKPFSPMLGSYSARPGPSVGGRDFRGWLGRRSVRSLKPCSGLDGSKNGAGSCTCPSQPQFIFHTRLVMQFKPRSRDLFLGDLSRNGVRPIHNLECAF